jgi:hypothetical protein
MMITDRLPLPSTCFKPTHSRETSHGKEMHWSTGGPKEFAPIIYSWRRARTCFEHITQTAPGRTRTARSLVGGWPKVERVQAAVEIKQPSDPVTGGGALSTSNPCPIPQLGHQSSRVLTQHLSRA